MDSGVWGIGPEQYVHQSRWGAVTPPLNNLSESLSQALCAAFLPVLPWLRAGFNEWGSVQGGRKVASVSQGLILLAREEGKAKTAQCENVVPWRWRWGELKGLAPPEMQG